MELHGLLLLTCACFCVLLRYNSLIADDQVLQGVEEHHGIVLVVVWQEAKEQQEHVVGPVAVADGHFFTLPVHTQNLTCSHP